MNEYQSTHEPITPDMEAYWQQHRKYGELLMKVSERQLSKPELTDDMRKHWERYNGVAANKIAVATDALHTLELGRLALGDE